MLYSKVHKPPLNKPATPELVAKIDRLAALHAECQRLRREIEQDWILLNKQDSERFHILQAELTIRKAERTKASAPQPGSQNKRRAPWKEELFKWE